MGKKHYKPEQTDRKGGVWGESEITRSQVFASGTVRRWLELADKAFGNDTKSLPAAEDPEILPEEASPPLKRAKSA